VLEVESLRGHGRYILAARTSAFFIRELKLNVLIRIEWRQMIQSPETQETVVVLLPPRVRVASHPPQQERPPRLRIIIQ